MPKTQCNDNCLHNRTCHHTQDIVVSFSNVENELFSRSYKEGQGWSNVSLLSQSYGYGDAEEHDVAIDEAGNAILVWVDSNNVSNDVVMAARYE